MPTPGIVCESDSIAKRPLLASASRASAAQLFPSVGDTSTAITFRPLTVGSMTTTSGKNGD